MRNAKQFLDFFLFGWFGLGDVLEDREAPEFQVRPDTDHIDIESGSMFVSGTKRAEQAWTLRYSDSGGTWYDVRIHAQKDGSWTVVAWDQEQVHGTYDVPEGELFADGGNQILRTRWVEDGKNGWEMAGEPEVLGNWDSYDEDDHAGRQLYDALVFGQVEDDSPLIDDQICDFDACTSERRCTDWTETFANSQDQHPVSEVLLLWSGGWKGAKCEYGQEDDHRIGNFVAWSKDAEDVQVCTRDACVERLCKEAYETRYAEHMNATEGPDAVRTPGPCGICEGSHDDVDCDMPIEHGPVSDAYGNSMRM